MKRTTPFDFSPPNLLGQDLPKISIGAVTPAVRLRTHFKVLSDEIDGNEPHHSIPRPQIYLVKIYRKSLSVLGCGSNRSVTNSLQKFSSRVRRAFQSIQRRNFVRVDALWLVYIWPLSGADVSVIHIHYAECFGRRVSREKKIFEVGL